MKKKFTWAILFLVALQLDSFAQKNNSFNPCFTAFNGFASLTPVTKTIEISEQLLLEYVEQGCNDGLPVILLHGFTDSWHSFEEVLPHLPANLHVYAISLRGHGNSSQPRQGYKPEDFSADIAGFIQQLGIQRPVLAGHSMGSTIVQQFATQYPELTRGIVLSGSFAHYNTTAVADFKQMIDQLTDPVDPAFAEGFQSGTAARPVAPSLMKMFVSETLKLPAYVWKAVAAGWATSSYYQQLKTFEKPALIIWGSKDAFCPGEDQQLLKNSLKNSTLKIYEGNGHAIHWEEPERFAADLVEFTGSLR